MDLPRLAALDALLSRVARPLSAAQRGRAEALLDDISAEVRDATGRTWTLPDGTLDPARPALLAVVVLRAAKRALDNPSELAAETVGDYSRRFADQADTGGQRGGVYLSAGERRMLAALTGGGDLVSVPVIRDVSVSDTVWVRDQYGGDALPWLTGEEAGR
ncbi:MAG TPA: hypothetical protein VF755_00990 [Catenuloplanes sp.]|jgi:hypothetical protein